jgi:hypothetical protein
LSAYIGASAPKNKNSRAKLMPNTALGQRMAQEWEKREKLKTLHQFAQTLLPRLAISQQNLYYYASLANFHNVYDLRRLKSECTP